MQRRKSRRDKNDHSELWMVGGLLTLAGGFYIASYGWVYLFWVSVLLAQAGLVGAIAVYFMRWRRQIQNE